MVFCLSCLHGYMKTPNLMKYMDDVKCLADMKGRWSFYDKYFRINREHSLDPWEDVNWKLWNKALSSLRLPYQESNNPKTRNILKVLLRNGPFGWTSHQGYVYTCIDLFSNNNNNNKNTWCFLIPPTLIII